MKVKILSYTKIRDNKYWIIGCSKLLDYLVAVDKDSKNKFNFEVQRKIVRNIYLDKILDTLKKFEPIPFITLTFSFEDENLALEPGKTIEISSFNILDGLQRTYRLWAYWKIFKDILKEKHPENVKDFMKEVKVKHPEFFDKSIINSKILKNLYNDYSELDKVFNDYEIYFVIWANLTENEIIKKMLILNAGQKPVSSRHQFELIFLHVEKELQDFLSEKGIEILRERDPKFNRSKKEREPGIYALSTLITALLSLATGKPQRVSSELIYKYDLMEEERSLSYAEDIFGEDFMKKTLEFLLKLDDKYSHDKETLVWLGKDTTLTGIFSAIGRYVGIERNLYSSFPKEKIIKGFNSLLDALPNDLKIDEFNKYYDSLAGRSLNIGMYIRKVVQYYTLSLLHGKKISWKDAFTAVERGDTV